MADLFLLRTISAYLNGFGPITEKVAAATLLEIMPPVKKIVIMELLRPSRAISADGCSVVSHPHLLRELFTIEKHIRLCTEL